MIKVYQITPTGRRFIKNKGFLELGGFLRSELRGCLQMYQKDAINEYFIFNTSGEANDHSFKQHMSHLEKMKCITRDTQLEEQMKDSVRSLSKEDREYVEYHLLLEELVGL